jgi:hypothetical protein
MQRRDRVNDAALREVRIALRALKAEALAETPCLARDRQAASRNCGSARRRCPQIGIARSARRTQ